MPKSERGDQQNFDDGELQHEWAGGTIDLTDERQTTALREDPKQRKLVIGGVAGCVLVICVVLGFAAGGGTEAAAEAPELVEDAQQIEPVSTEPAVEPAVVETKAAVRKDGGERAAGPKRPTADMPAGHHVASATRSDPAPGASDSAAESNELPDVEQWEDADDEALREQGPGAPKPVPSDG